MNEIIMQIVVIICTLGGWMLGCLFAEWQDRRSR